MSTELEAAPRVAPSGLPRLALSLVIALLASTGLASCEDRAFGLPLPRFREILAGRDAEPILALTDRELGDPGDLGPEASYYLGRWLEERSRRGPGTSISASETAARAAAEAASRDELAARKAALLYRAAYDRGKGEVRLAAGRALVAALARAKDWESLLGFARERSAAEGPDWESDRPALDAMAALGRAEALAAALESLREAFPAQAERDAEAFLYFEGCAKRRLGEPGWSLPLRALVLARPASASLAPALAELESAEPPLLPPAELAAARARAAVQAKDYGAAYRAIQGHLTELLSPDSTPAFVADAGKAYLYTSGKAAEGLSLFSSLESKAEAAAAARRDPEASRAAARVAWTALFYRARLTAALERWTEAAALFRVAAATAPEAAETASAEEGDAARWYCVDATAKAAKSGGAKARRATVAAIAWAARAWAEPEGFSDLIDDCFRASVQARDWGSVLELRAAIEGKAEAGVQARVSYAAARALELGWYAPAELRGRGRGVLASEARSRFLEIAADPGSPLHYRALAAWRSGADLELIPQEAGPSLAAPSPAGTAPGPGQSFVTPHQAPEAEAFALGFSDFCLPELAVAEARSRSASGELDCDSLRRLARALALDGWNDASLRVAALLMGRPDRESRRADYELLYPRPWLDAFRALAPRPSCPEQLLYGLVRSESLFNAGIVSRAGAVGLAQLMPSTAADLARRLKIAAYDLAEPADNLRLGSALFSDLIEEGGRPLRAMMAYNAGRARLRRWASSYGDLPDDLFLEAVDYAETRQYGRNILAASAMYGELYYGVRAAETARYAVEGGTLGERSWAAGRPGPDPARPRVPGRGGAG